MKAVLNAQKSAEAIVPGGKKTPGKGRTNTSPSRRRKEDGMTKVEYAGNGRSEETNGILTYDRRVNKMDGCAR